MKKQVTLSKIVHQKDNMYMIRKVTVTKKVNVYGKTNKEIKDETSRKNKLYQLGEL